MDEPYLAAKRCHIVTLMLFQPSQPVTPIIVKVVDAPSHPFRDVVVGALGLSGLILLGALLLGLVLGLCFIGLHIHRRRQQTSQTDHQQLHLSG